jgi:anti-sigma-K factor RskA
MSADIHGLSGAYAVDALNEHERAAFEAHLAQCAECQHEVASLRAAAAELSHLTSAAPPPALRQAVLSRIATTRPLPPLETNDSVVHLASWRRRLPTTWLVAAAAAVVFALGGLVWGVTRPEPEPRVDAAEQVIRASDAERLTKTIDGARATIVRSPSLRKAVLIADNMPAAPAGRDFQLWLDQPGRGMVSAGVMPHDHAPTVTLLLEGDASTATGAGITVEPAGGSREPTSEPIALFAFS